MHPVLAQVDFNTFLQKNYIDIGGAFIAVVVALGLLLIFSRWKVTLRELAGGGRRRLSSSTKARLTLRSIVVNVLYQKPIVDCSRPRWAMHFMTFWGFVLLAISTTLDAIMNPSALPLPLFHPVRIVGNVGGLLFLAGLCLYLSRYLTAPSVRKNSSSGDFVFIGLLLLVTITGFITEILSDTTTLSLDSFAFWSHLILVGGLLITAPFTKFIHAIGRPTLLLMKRLAEEKERVSTEPEAHA